MLSAAKHLSRLPEGPFASLRVTWCRVKKIGFPYESTRTEKESTRTEKESTRTEKESTQGV